MSELRTRAELVKLSRVLGAKEADLAFLAPLGVDGLRQLGERLSDTLFDEYRSAFQRLADASRLLPASLVARMAELVFGPVIAARVSGLMPPKRAIEVATRLKTKFLAEVTMQLDPRSASALLALMPTRIVIEVAQFLLQRREYVTMGRFVDDLTDEAIRAVTDSLKDDEALVRIGLYVERRERLNELVDLLGPERIKRIVGAVASGAPDVQAAGLAMMSQWVLQGTGAEGRATFARMLAGMDAATLDAWAKATTDANLWPAALKILAASNVDLQEEAAQALKRLGAPARAAIARALHAEQLESTLTVVKAALG